MVVKVQAARYLPKTAVQSEIGKVNNSSIEPERRSSAQSRMAIAGTRKR